MVQCIVGSTPLRLVVQLIHVLYQPVFVTRVVIYPILPGIQQIKHYSPKRVSYEAIAAGFSSNYLYGV